jgi:DNA-binding beta-propeller fold protein YncE
VTKESDTFPGNLEEGAAGGPAVLDGHGVVVSPDGKHVYTAVGYQRNSLCVYQRDQATGQFPSYHSRASKKGDNGITDMGYPYDVDISPDGKHLYVPCQASNSLLLVLA